MFQTIYLGWQYSVKSINILLIPLSILFFLLLLLLLLLVIVDKVVQLQ